MADVAGSMYPQLGELLLGDQLGQLQLEIVKKFATIILVILSSILLQLVVLATLLMIAMMTLLAAD